MKLVTKGEPYKVSPFLVFFWGGGRQKKIQSDLGRYNPGQTYRESVVAFSKGPRKTDPGPTFIKKKESSINDVEQV